MRILDKILHSETGGDAKREASLEEPACPHTSVVAHWEMPGDIGRPELATYKCESCGQAFSYYEARQYMETPPPVVASISDSDRRFG